MTYNRFDVILVHFPFSEKRGQKQRPGIVLTNSDFNRIHKHALTAMVTTASNTKWPTDVPLAEFVEAGLRNPSVARMKLFTVAEHLVLGRVGTLSLGDQRSVAAGVRSLLED